MNYFLLYKLVLKFLIYYLYWNHIIPFNVFCYQRNIVHDMFDPIMLLNNSLFWHINNLRLIVYISLIIGNMLIFAMCLYRPDLRILCFKILLSSTIDNLIIFGTPCLTIPIILLTTPTIKNHTRTTHQNRLPYLLLATATNNM